MGRMSDLDIERQMHEADLQAESDWQQQEELHRDVERVVELACRSLSPTDQTLLRWATGIQPAQQEQPKDYPLFPEDGSDPF